MKKFLLKTGLLVVSLFICNELSSPRLFYYCGNSWNSAKIEYLLLLESQLQQPRILYWENASNVIVGARAILNDKSLNKSPKKRTASKYETSYLENAFLSKYLKFLLEPRNNSDILNGLNNDEYLVLSFEVENTKNEEVKWYLLDRKTVPLMDTFLLANQKTSSIQMLKASYLKFNEVHLKNNDF